MNQASSSWSFGHKSQFASQLTPRRSNTVLYGGTLQGGTIYSHISPLVGLLGQFLSRQNKGTKIVRHCPRWCIPAQRVIATGKGRRLECKEAARSWWKQQTGGQREQARKGYIHWRERSRDGWGGGMPDLLREIESNSLSAKVAETNGWDRAWVSLLWTPRQWCLSGQRGLSGGFQETWLTGKMCSLHPRWVPVKAHVCLSRHIKKSGRRRSPDSVSGKCSGCLHNQKHFLAELWSVFLLFWSESILKQSSYLFVLWLQEVELIFCCCGKAKSKALQRNWITVLHRKLSVSDFVAIAMAPTGMCWLDRP